MKTIMKTIMAYSWLVGSTSLFFWGLFDFSAIQTTCCCIVHSCETTVDSEFYCSATTQLALDCNFCLSSIAASLFMFFSLMAVKIFWHML